MSEKIELFKQFSKDQEKFTYYIIALSVTAIGFSIVRTSGLELSYNQIPLAIAILSWGISVYSGFCFLEYRMSTSYANIELFNVHEGKNKDVGNNPVLQQAATEGINEAIKSNSDEAFKYWKLQKKMFYAGVVFYVFWHILEMYILTNQ